MKPWWRKLAKVLAVLALIGSLGALGIAWLGREPDFNVTWSRRIPAEATLADLTRDLWRPENWLRWFFYLDSIEAVDEAGDPVPGGPRFAAGARLRLHMDPKKGFSRKSELLVRILEFDPARGIALRLEFDSSGKLTGLFDQLTWKLELKPGPGGGGGVILEGTETARTRAPRSRAYCRAAPSVLLNQVFPMDLLGLARIKKLDEPPPVRVGF
jgi:hypothetical protein